MPGLQLVFVAPSLPPPTLGGASLYVRDLAQQLRQHGHAVILVCAESDPSRPEGALTEGTNNGVPVVRINVGAADFISQLKNQRGATVIAEVAQALRADLVHIHHL